MQNFTWLHFSDLHFASKAGYDSTYMRSKFVEFLSERDFMVDYVFVTGDVANRGIYDGVTKFMHDLLDVLKLDAGHVFWAPGNHDISRNVGERNARIQKIRESPEELSNTMLNDSERTLLTYMGIVPYYDHHAEILQNDITRTGMVNPNHLYHLEHLDLMVLNTCITSCDDNDEHRLFLATPQLIDKMKEVDKKKPLFIIGHHGLNNFHDAEKKRITDLMDDYADLYLCGHTHMPGYEEFPNCSRTIPQLTCGGGIPDRYSYFTFFHGAFFAQDNSIQITPYSYAKDTSHQWHEDYTSSRRLDGKTRIILTRLTDLPRYSGTRMLKKDVPTRVRCQLWRNSRIIEANISLSEVAERLYDIFYAYHINIAPDKRYTNAGLTVSKENIELAIKRSINYGTNNMVQDVDYQSIDAIEEQLVKNGLLKKSNDAVCNTTDYGLAQFKKLVGNP